MRTAEVDGFPASSTRWSNDRASVQDTATSPRRPGTHSIAQTFLLFE